MFDEFGFYASSKYFSSWSARHGCRNSTPRLDGTRRFGYELLKDWGAQESPWEMELRTNLHHPMIESHMR